jgi:probable DNA metabolism protein
MLYYLYDKSFEGFLTAVFDTFFRRETPDRITGMETAVPMFTGTHAVNTDSVKAGRVFDGLKKKISRPALCMLHVCFLSELPDIELVLLRYIQKVFSSNTSIELNFADDDVLALSKIYRKVKREEERMRQFVRFRKTADGMYFAVMEPLYNVMPLCIDFFQNRYADQPWIIYDIRRNFGFYYDLKKTETVSFSHLDVSLLRGQLSAEQSDRSEADFQALWKDYLRAVTISERKNLRLQRQFMPKRFWKYLVEKQ